MPSNKAIGDIAEKDCVSTLEAQGYFVCRAWRQYSPIAPGKWISKNADFWNAFDVMAAKQGERIRLIQVTTEQGAWAKKKRQVTENAPEGGWPLEHVSVEIWVSKRRKMEKGMTRKEFQKWKRFDIKKLDDNFKSIEREYIT